MTDVNWLAGSPLAQITYNVLDKEPYTRTIQYEGRSKFGGYHVRHLGSQQDIVVRSVAQHTLAKHMLAPEVKDVSNFLLCPMPGTLISLSVAEGQTVEAGQQLAVVEAMKMQNILRAEKKGVVKSIRSQAGARLKVDEVIIEFEFAEAVAAVAK